MAGSNQNQGSKQAAKAKGRSVSPTKPAGGRQVSALLTWGIVGLVVVIIAVLVVVSLSGKGSDGNGNASGKGGFEAAPASLVAKATGVPASVFDKVGINSPTVPVTAPTLINGEPALTFQGGKVTTPGFFYFGSEYCPFCAAERWAAVVALSRFGKLGNLGLTTSSSTDVYPDTPTFSFAQATWSSDVLATRLVEQYGRDGKTEVMKPTKQDLAIMDKYDTTKYFPGGSAGSIPFISINNRGLVSGASYSPSVLNGLSAEEIANGLSNASSPVTQAIIATANYLSAVICSQTSNAPANVCSSKGVQAAKAALKL